MSTAANIMAGHCYEHRCGYSGELYVKLANNSQWILCPYDETFTVFIISLLCYFEMNYCVIECWSVIYESLSVTFCYTFNLYLLFCIAFINDQWPVCTQVAGYVGRIRCPPPGLLCTTQHSHPSTVAHQSPLSYGQVIVTAFLHNVTSSNIHSHSKFGVLIYIRDSYIGLRLNSLDIICSTYILCWAVKV